MRVRVTVSNCFVRSDRAGAKVLGENGNKENINIKYWHGLCLAHILWGTMLCAKYICAKQTESNNLLTAQWLCDCTQSWCLLSPPPLLLCLHQHRNPPVQSKVWGEVEGLLLLMSIVIPEQCQVCSLPPSLPSSHHSNYEAGLSSEWLLLGQTREFVNTNIFVLPL